MMCAAAAEDNRSEPGAVCCQVSLRWTHSTESNGVCVCVCVCVCWGGGGGGDYCMAVSTCCVPCVSAVQFGNIIA